MLAAALRWVKSDGFVLYATCSLQPEEGEQVVTEVISKGLAMLDSFSSEELGLFSPALSTEGWVRILPTCLSGERLPPAKAGTYSETGNDGFYCAAETGDSIIWQRRSVAVCKMSFSNDF